ncbi:hypothetical protein FJTKL_02412 [Diaporthe vaccinii]|uniref:HpcH/HpaI aldolase/citrate lyase domain-containing protein n=1 Tax=Diaporthe vaccinii TaxID=105482 RepID=A0ABR4DYG3_9PEZI
MGSTGTNGTSSSPTMSISNPFRTRVLSGQFSAVISVKFLLTNEMAMMYKTAGIHGMFLDMEHSTQDLHAVAQLVVACNFVGVSPIVRVPSKSPFHLSRALDAGAASVVVPHVDSVAEAQDLVRAAKYAPLGQRGSTNNQPLFDFRHVPFAAQTETLNRETMLIPMIETPAAVAADAEILALDGVDGLLIGSNDLCADLGIPGQYDNPPYQDAVTSVVLEAKRAGRPVGIGGIGGRQDLLEKWFAMGASWSLSGADGSIIQAGMKKIGDDYAEINKRVQKLRST